MCPRKYLAEWGFKKLQLQATMSNASSIQTETGNRRECVQNLKKALLTWVNEMHAQEVDVSSKMIKEMGIRILDRVN